MTTSTLCSCPVAHVKGVTVCGQCGKALETASPAWPAWAPQLGTSTGLPAVQAVTSAPAAPWERIGGEIGRLVAEKQAAYGDSFGKAGAVMRILYPDGVPPEKMDDALTVVRVLDKLFRIATSRDALGESPWRDIAGYALLSVARVEGAKEQPR